jgi:hypothetical protein
MGHRCSDLSLSYDIHFRDDRHAGLNKLSSTGYLDPNQIDSLIDLIQPEESGLWAKIHPHSWFQDIENRCEQILDELGLNTYFGLIPLTEIRERHPVTWSQYDGISLHDLAHSLLMEYSRQRSEVTRLLFLVRSSFQ